MPSSKYYRSGLPLDILQLCGDYAGDDLYKLKFTLSPKRKFLSHILMIWRHPQLYCDHKKRTVILNMQNWRAVRLGCVNEILTLLGEKCRLKLPKNILIPEMKKIAEILTEVHNYKLKRNNRNKVW